MSIPRSLGATSLLCSLAGAMLASSSPSQTPPTWSRTYGGAVDQQGLYDVRAIAGGRLVAVGYTASFGGPSSWSWLLNLDAATGNVGVQRASTSSFGGYTDGAKVAADGGALFLGRDVVDFFAKHDGWVMRADPSGNVVWSRRFTGLGNSGRYFLFDALELNDGSWIAVGATSVIDQPPQNAWILRLSAQGNVMWQSEYGGGQVETARSVIRTSDGGFAVAGWSNSSGAGSDDVWVMKIDVNGAIQWQKTYGGFDADQAEGIVQLNDGGYAVAGYTNSFTASGHSPWVLRLDGAGNPQWSKIVGSQVWGDLGAITKTGDGQIVVEGRVAELGFPSNDLWAAKLSAADGRALWQRAYEGELGDFGTVVLPLENGLVIGGTWGWGFPGESIWLNRTDREGRLLGCSIARKTDFGLLAPRLSVGNGAAVRLAPSAQVVGTGVQIAPSNAVVTDVCR